MPADVLGLVSLPIPAEAASVPESSSINTQSHIPAYQLQAIF